ncbi:hypothetical protein T484DRAFT_1886593, partial [Baffinella frigidus]
MSWRLGSDLAARLATGLVRGHNPSEEEALCDSWLRSPLYARGIGAEVTVGAMEASAQASVVRALQQPLVAVRALQQPLVAVRLAPELDTLECLTLVAVRLAPELDTLECLGMVVALHHCGVLDMVMVVALHHCGVLDMVLATDDASRPSWLEAICQSVSLAARQVRRHVMELRDLSNLTLKESEEPKAVGLSNLSLKETEDPKAVGLSNLSLKESQEPKGWDVFCEPLLRRGSLLLQVTPMCLAPSSAPGGFWPLGSSGGLARHWSGGLGSLGSSGASWDPRPSSFSKHSQPSYARNFDAGRL